MFLFFGGGLILVLLDKWGQTYELCSMDSYTWTYQCWPTSKTLHLSTLCGHWISSRDLTMTNNNRWQESIKRIHAVSVPWWWWWWWGGGGGGGGLDRQKLCYYLSFHHVLAWKNYFPSLIRKSLFCFLSIEMQYRQILKLIRYLFSVFFSNKMFDSHIIGISF